MATFSYSVKPPMYYHNQFELASYCMCFMLDYRKPVIKQLMAVANECFRWPLVTQNVLVYTCRVARQYSRDYSEGGRLCAVWNIRSGWRRGQFWKPVLHWSQLLPQVNAHIPSPRTIAVHFWTRAIAKPAWGSYWSVLLQFVQWGVCDTERAVLAHTPVS